MSQDVEETSKKNDEEVKENLIVKEEASKKSKKEIKKANKEEKKANKEEKKKEEKSNDIKDELVSAQEETKSWKDKYYYMAAELENARKRFSREKEKLIKFGNDQILSEFIDVIDNFDHSIAALDKEKDEKSKIILDGVHMVRKQFLDVLFKNGLKEVEAIGKIFDPNFHEAIAKQPAEDKKEDEIVTEYQKGYTLNGRLLRPSKVVVAKKK